MTAQLLVSSSVVSVLILLSGASDAYAACIEVSPDVYDCDGGPAPTFTGESVTVNVLPGAAPYGDLSITGPGTSTVNNDGSLSNQVVSTDNDSFTLNNRGAIAGNILLNGSGNNTIRNYASGTLSSGIISSGNSNDTIVNRGVINSAVNLGGGNDVVQLIGGTIRTNVDLGSGDDSFYWVGGEVSAGFTVGDGNDIATLVGLNQDNLTAGMRIDGGLGDSDRLVFVSSTNEDERGGGNAPSNLVNWESISLTQNSSLKFIYTNGFLILGDEGLGTGSLSIDGSSKVYAGGTEGGGYGVASYDTNRLVRVTNAGIIDLTNDPQTSNPHDRFTIKGDYIGQGGTVALHTYLAGDDSPSDRLLISGSGALASGSTTLAISNVGGPGGLTSGDGILVVDAINGAGTETGAFSLNGPLGAGIFEYDLYRGGVSDNAETDDDWFLRNWVQPEPAPGPDPDPTPGPDPDPTPGPDPDPTPGPDPDPTPGPDPDPTPGPEPDPTPGPVPSIRPAIPGYVVTPALVQTMGLATLGTFHDRQGDQFLLSPDGNFKGAWARVFGHAFDQGWTSRVRGLNFDLHPGVDGSMWGIQLGLDFIGSPDDQEGQNRAGMFFAYSGLSADTLGNTLGRINAESGRVEIHGTSGGAYWTHLWENDAYLDTIAMYTWLDGTANANRGIGAEIGGHSVVASIEGGRPFDLDDGWVIEPQAQLIWQNINMQDGKDTFTKIDYDTFNAWTGRLGVRFEKNTAINETPVQPFLSLDLWHNFNDNYSVAFNGLPVTTDLVDSSVELKVGISAQFNDSVSVYAEGMLSGGLEDVGDYHGYGGNVGLRVRW